MKSLPLLIPLLLAAARRFVHDCGYAVSQVLLRHMARNGLVLFGYWVPEGSTFYFTDTLGTAKGITALSNADPARATSTAHGFLDGNEVLLTSGWEEATDAIYRLDVNDANSFDLLGLDASDTGLYAAGGGTGTAQLVSGWTEIPQVLGIGGGGGDPRYTTISPLKRRQPINMPVGFNPSNIELTLGQDESLPAMQALRRISRRRGKVGYKMAISGGAVIYAYGTLALNNMPSLQSGQAITLRLAISVDGQPVVYYGV
jgi:hypothetical protein